MDIRYSETINFKNRKMFSIIMRQIFIQSRKLKDDFACLGEMQEHSHPAANDQDEELTKLGGKSCRFVNARGVKPRNRAHITSTTHPWDLQVFGAFGSGQ